MGSAWRAGRSIDAPSNCFLPALSSSPWQTVLGSVLITAHEVVLAERAEAKRTYIRCGGHVGAHVQLSTFQRLRRSRFSACTLMVALFVLRTARHSAKHGAHSCVSQAQLLVTSFEHHAGHEVGVAAAATEPAPLPAWPPGMCLCRMLGGGQSGDGWSGTRDGGMGGDGISNWLLMDWTNVKTKITLPVGRMLAQRTSEWRRGRRAPPRNLCARAVGDAPAPPRDAILSRRIGILDRNLYR